MQDTILLLDIYQTDIDRKTLLDEVLKECDNICLLMYKYSKKNYQDIDNEKYSLLSSLDELIFTNLDVNKSYKHISEGELMRAFGILNKTSKTSIYDMITNYNEWTNFNNIILYNKEKPVLAIMEDATILFTNNRKLIDKFNDYAVTSEDKDYLGVKQILSTKQELEKNCRNNAIKGNNYTRDINILKNN